MNIPRIMSTQHPDNVQIPFFAESQDMSGEDEVQEAYYAFSHLGCDEQMWDCEGKEVDDFVVRKLLTRYEPFFRRNKLGREVRITLRVPNPTVERQEAKVLIETLESIPRSYDIARVFYNEDIPPIFEVILPMTTSSQSLGRIYHYYRDFVTGKQHRPFFPGDITIAEWVGEFRPEAINVIPLFEDRDHMLASDAIVREYLQDKVGTEQRVFLARSDPAMNYGMVSAVLCNKIALQRLRALSREIGVGIYPILGAGSAPFRGHLTPATVDNVMAEYPDVQTFTVQSAFKYDHAVSDVISAVRRIHETPLREGLTVDEERCLAIIDKVSIAYARQIEALAPLINLMAGFVPRRRMRKLHVGLFGYARSLGNVTLPRVIGFCAACYSIGLPPELLGLQALSKDELKFIRTAYVNFDFDMASAMQYFNPEAFSILPEGFRGTLALDCCEHRVNEMHRAVTSRIIQAVKDGRTNALTSMIVEAAHIRKFLG